MYSMYMVIFVVRNVQATYNFESQDNHNYQCPWERYSLLNHLYSIIEDKPDLRVNLGSTSYDFRNVWWIFKYRRV